MVFRRIGRFVLGLALCAATAAALAAPCSLALVATLELQPFTALLPAQIDGQPVLLKLDTGSFTTILTETTASRLRLHKDPDQSEHFRGVSDRPWQVLGVGGTRLGEVVLAHRFALGGMTGSNFHFLTADIGLKRADGLLSTDFLRDYDIDLDFAGNQVRLFRAVGACERAKVYLQPPLFSVPLITSDDDVRPRIAVTIEGQRFTALLDTGAERTVMSANAAFRLGIVSDGAGGTKMVHGIGPRAVPASMHVVRSIGIGDLTLPSRSVMVLGESFGLRDDVLLGADIQRLLHFWISNSARTLIMQFPAQASPPVR